MLPPNQEEIHFAPPLAIIHDFYPEDGNIRQSKIQFYRDSGEQIGCRDPLEYGKIVEIEEWMKI